MARGVKEFVESIARRPVEFADEAQANEVEAAQMLALLASVGEAVMSGEVVGLAVVGVTHRSVHDGFAFAEQCNRYAMVGALEALKRDVMRTEIESRVEYAEYDDEDE